MTKDGRPSRINDVRYFSGSSRSYLSGLEDATAFGRRFALYLNAEGYSAGAHTAVYIWMTSSLAPGDIKVTDDGGDWWQRYTHVGVPAGFRIFLKRRIW